MKALVLAGGQGSRLKNLTDDKNKCLYEFRNRPLIEYSLENARKARVTEIVIIVSYKAELIINRFGNNYKGTPIKYVIQWDPKGVVHAIECSQNTLGNTDFMLFLADEVFIDPRHLEMIQCFEKQNVFALCGIVEVNNSTEIKKTYAVI